MTSADSRTARTRRTSSSTRRRSEASSSAILHKLPRFYVVRRDRFGEIFPRHGQYALSLQRVMLVHRFIVRWHFAKHSAKHFRRSFHKHAISHLSFLRLPQSPRAFHFADHRHASIRALKPVPEHRREASRALASHPLGRRQRPRSRREIPSAMLQRGEFHLIPE